MTELPAGRPELVERIRTEILAGGPISFARFMEIALHDPEHGYYAGGPARLGRSGDFFTASDVGPAFGAALAHQLDEMDRALGRPAPFRYVEVGAGRGWLARDVLDAWEDARGRVRTTLVDSSRGMREAAAARVPEARVCASAREESGGAGAVIAVELLDALPVHRVRRTGHALAEVRVAVEGTALREVEAPAGTEVAAWAAAYGLAPEDGDEAEVCLALGPAIRELASILDRGFVVVVDYGHDAARLAARAHRRGTLLAYHRHAVHERYLERVGEQDLTAHVNLTALAREAERAGLRTLGTTTQDRFLVANGLLQGLDEAGEGAGAVKRRLQAKQLIHPDGMGRAFKVAIFSKGIEPAPALRGLKDPFGGGAR
ncbi:MAG TPA: SAM-dependent methyltransferase [Candidatus Polarisedimenticolaceae bacterium]|nr:SAM-dependent methyltransferase [Candidatus Polarisedimenticolaceae bacterium]